MLPTNLTLRMQKGNTEGSAYGLPKSDRERTDENPLSVAHVCRMPKRANDLVPDLIAKALYKLALNRERNRDSQQAETTIECAVASRVILSISGCLFGPEY